jgi:hypothetical protein
MESIIFTLAYILLLVWVIAIAYSALSVAWEMTGLSRELFLLRQSFSHLFKRIKNIEWKKMQFTSSKKLIHN